jgi:transposase
VFAAVDRGMPVYEAAPLYQVSVSYIYKALARRRQTGEIAARPQCSHTPPMLLDYHDALETRLAQVPDATLAELRAWLLREHGVKVSQGAMWSTLRRLGLTRKKSRGTRPSRSGPTSPRPAASGARDSRR